MTFENVFIAIIKVLHVNKIDKYNYGAITISLTVVKFQYFSQLKDYQIIIWWNLYPLKHNT